MVERPANEQGSDEGKVVYRRVDAPEQKPRPDETGGSGPTAVEHRLAPTLTALLIGFALLLALIFSLGYLSVRKLNEVSTEILYQERQHSINSRLTLQFLVATTRLNNEARARARVEGTGRTSPEEVRPLFDVPLRKARAQVQELLQQTERPPYSQSEKWRKLHQDVTELLNAAEDPETYSLQGFVKYRSVSDDIDELLAALDKEQEEILQRREDLENAAARRINRLTSLALLAGALVAAGTVWEVNRRFRQVQQSLNEARRERQFSTQILEGMVSAVAAIDADDRIRSANTAFMQIFPRASIGASMHDGFASDEAMKMLEATTATRVKEATYRGRWICNVETPECQDRTFDVYSSPLDMDGEQGQILTLVDVTEAAQAEAELRRSEALAAVGQAAAQVAHEIKNPLGSIRLGVSMLRDSVRDKEALNTIDLVERGIHHLNQLVVNVTQFSRQRALQRAEADLQDLINESLELVADRIREKQTPVEKRFSPEPLRGEWDADKLRQVFVNLLANAVDASAEKSPIIIYTERTTIERKPQEGGNGHHVSGASPQQAARIVITDQGSGMDEETRQRIFEPFFTTKKRGTGLGLAIVKQIIEQHDGTISVESAPNRGTRFTIELPLNMTM